MHRPVPVRVPVPVPVLAGSGNGLFYGIFSYIKPAIDHSGYIWVADVGNNRVNEFSPSGQWMGTIGGGTSCTGCRSTSACTCTGAVTNGNFGAGSLWKPLIDASGNIWVTDPWNNNRVNEFSSTGSFILSLGGTGGPPGTCTLSPGTVCPTGSANGQFSTPFGIAFDAGGNLWVADYGNSRMQKFSNINGVWTWQQSIPPVPI